MNTTGLASLDLEAFVQQAERAGCRVLRCDESDLGRTNWWERVVADAANAPDIGSLTVGETLMPRIAVAQSLVDDFAGAARLLLDHGATCTGDPVPLLRCAVGVSACAAAIAETGSLLLAGAEPADRLVWLLPPRSVLLVRARDVLPSLDDAMAWLRTHPEAGVATLVTGPSRTSDVERVLTIGVQGPREVIVALVTETEAG